MSVKALKRAQYEADQARKRLEARLLEIQNRLQPAALTSNAWEGVKEKGTEIAGDAVQAIKERPVAVSAGLTAFTLFLARRPIISGISRLFSSRDEDDDLALDGSGTSKMNDLAAPVVAREHEGAKA